MPRKNRLTGAEIRALRSPRRVHGDYFTVMVGRTEGTHAKCACVVSKKVFPKAHDRNTLKRRCRAAFSEGLELLPAAAYIFQAKKHAQNANSDEVARDIARLIRTLASRA